MKLVSPLPHRRGRLEIIPLIDIMFFLLAAFMLVSIDKIKVKSLKVNLPTNVPTAQIEKKEDFITVSVDADGRVQVDKELITSKDQVLPKLQALYAQNKDQKFLIASDREAKSGDLLGILGELRAAGFQKIAFDIDTKPPLDPAVVPASVSAPAVTTTAPASTPVSSASSSTDGTSPASASASPSASESTPPAPLTQAASSLPVPNAAPEPVALVPATSVPAANP